MYCFFELGPILNPSFYLTLILVIFIQFNHASSLANIHNPNVILILADDLGVETIEAFGGKSYHTPELTKMAGNGRIYPFMHATPLCTPSRNSLLTGKNSIQNYLGFGYLNPSEKTLGHYFKEMDYQTIIVGKWQLAEQGGMRPKRTGFNEHFLWNVDHARRGSRYWNPTIVENSKYHKFKDEFGPDLFLQKIKRAIHKHKAEPFFIYYPMVLPHTPFVLTPLQTKSDSSLTKQEKFSKMVEYMDYIVGQIRTELVNQKLDSTTVLIFMGDNGTDRNIVSRYKGRDVHGGKALTLNSGIRVPLIIEWNGQIQAGTIDSTLLDISTLFEGIIQLSTGIDIKSIASTRTINQIDPFVEFDIYSSWLNLDYEYRYNPNEWFFQYFQPLQNNTQLKAFVQNKEFKLYSDGRFYKMNADPLETIDRQNSLKENIKDFEVHTFLQQKLDQVNSLYSINQREDLLGRIYQGPGFSYQKDSIKVWGLPGTKYGFVDLLGRQIYEGSVGNEGEVSLATHFRVLLNAINNQAVK